jgi:hypothetical protein
MVARGVNEWVKEEWRRTWGDLYDVHENDREHFLKINCSSGATNVLILCKQTSLTSLCLLVGTRDCAFHWDMGRNYLR